MREDRVIPDLHLPQPRVLALVDIDVDGEMGVDVAHLVLEALGHADDEVVDEGADGAESGDVLAYAMVQLDVDDVLFRLGEADGDVVETLGEFA